MSQGTGTLVASAVITGFAIVAVALRFYVRMRLKIGVAWDDWSIFIGLILTLITAGLLVWGISVDPDAENLVQEAIDNHTLERFPARLHATYLKLNFVCSLLYFQIVTAIKVSILLMYRRIFAVNPAFRLQSLLLGITIFAFWVAATAGSFIDLRPGCYSWVNLSSSDKCLNFNIFWMATGIAEILIDTLLLALPVRRILELQLSRKSKASVVFIFLLGGFVVITGILRVVYGYVPGSRMPSYSGAGLWSAVHIGIAIVCACLPTLRPLATSFSSFNTAFSSLRQRYYSMRGHKASNSDDMRPLSTKDNVTSDGPAIEMVRGSGTISLDSRTDGLDYGSPFLGVGRDLSLA